MELLVGFDVPEGNPKVYVLKLNKSIYSLKQSSLNWFNLLSSALQKEGQDFVPSPTDPCLFIQKDR
eukprot:9414879-Ditylum_brightwellii.AAC.1